MAETDLDEKMESFLKRLLNDEEYEVLKIAIENEGKLLED